MKNILRPFIKIYHKILGLFFEFDAGIYALSTPKIPTTRIFDYEYNKEVKINELLAPSFVCQTTQLKPPVIIFYKAPSLMDLLKIHNQLEEIIQNLKIKEEKTAFTVIPRNYNLALETSPKIFKTILEFFTKTNKVKSKEIYISRNVKTIEELLALEPYTHKYSIKKIKEMSIIKYPIKKEKFSEHQIELMRTKLAIQAKCKKYSINVDSIYDKFPEGLYCEIKLEKDDTLKCKFSPDAQCGDLQLLVVGKRKYDTQNTTAYIKYSELGL